MTVWAQRFDCKTPARLFCVSIYSRKLLAFNAQYMEVEQIQTVITKLANLVISCLF